VEEKEEEIERVCFNCNAFFPVLDEGPSEFGICLEDKEFEPYTEELLENCNYDCCKDLIERKKFSGNCEACPEFSEAEITDSPEIDDNSELGRALLSAIKGGPFNMERLRELFLQEQMRNIDLTTWPIAHHCEKLKSPEREERDAGIRGLGGLAGFGNKAAFEELFKYLRGLPPLTTIEEVHFKLRILGSLGRSEFRTSLTKFLLDELYNTPSNLTTRQWISAILELLRRCPAKDVCGPLEKMLKEKRFSYKLKKKVEYLLYDLKYGI